MKTFLILLLCMSALIDRIAAQNPDLPQGKSTIYFNDGKQIRTVKLWDVQNNRLEYERDGSLHDVYIDKIDRIKNNEDYYSFVNDTLQKIVPTIIPSTAIILTDTTVVINQPDSSVYFYGLGKSDAGKYYRGGGAYMAGLLTGPFLAPIIAAIPPHNPGKNNPNTLLYYKNEDYRKGYIKTAHSKKVTNVIGGLATLLLMSLIASANE